VFESSGLLKKAYDWLAASDPLQRSDMILVLAGRECRKRFGLKLLQDGWAPTLLLSVGRFEIRRFSKLGLSTSFDLVAMAAATEPRYRHYFVKIGSETAQARRIAIGRFGTFSEILAFSDWLQEHSRVRSVTVVSSGFHLKRVRMCCRRLVPQDTKLNFVAVPEESLYLREHWWRDPHARKLVISEFFKTGVYRLLSRKVMAGSRPIPVFADGTEGT